MPASGTRITLVLPDLQPIRRWLMTAMDYCGWAYAVGLLIWLGLLEWYGERNWVVSVGLYLPIQTWLLPLVILVPAALALRPRFCWMYAVLVLFVLGIFGGYRCGHQAPPETARSLTVVTNNIGQSNHQSMQPFLAKEHPDLIGLQDAANRGPAYSREYPDRFVVGRGEFMLISKYPVLTADLVPGVQWNNQPVAARFELSFKEHPLVVYLVHMPTPRPDFAKLRRLGLLKEILGRNRRKSDGRSYAESMQGRIELAKKLAGVFQQEKKPFIVAGDFNMPSHGGVYHIFARVVRDAFEKAGSGYGYSFPGVSSHLLMLFGPWLRLDYLFAGNGWEPVYCRVEPDRPSQHRAVVARFEPLH